ncbi:MAG: hypothetical protein R3C99_00240 [Pirellulaceae bacterium]
MWQKQSIVFAPCAATGWIRSHAQVPTIDSEITDRVRVYFGTRLDNNRTVTTYLEVDADNPARVLYVHDRPVLGLGELGCFDDCGAMPSCIVNVDGRKLLYYTGWNTSTTVPYRNSIGVAVSDDGGLTFERLYPGPILDRTFDEPHFCATPYVMREDGVWRMWYLSCTKWHTVDGRPEPQYLIRQAESDDGIVWRRLGVALDYAASDEALARPWVVRSNDGYEMWYCQRSIRGYRSDRQSTYRIRRAVSENGRLWQRDALGVSLPASETGWDSEMTAYPAVWSHAGRRFLFYNGNGFGQSGFGFARWKPN